MTHRRCVYFLRSGDAIKVGCTAHIDLRIRAIELQIDAKVEYLGAIYGTFQTENLIHKRLAPYADGEREWFRDCQEVRSLIAYLLAKGPHFHGLPPSREPHDAHRTSTLRTA